MQIVETIIINRANTTIDWPSSTLPLTTDPTNPWLTANITFTSNVSSDELSKTFVRNWHVKEEFIQCHIYNGPNSYANFDSIATIGITHSRIIETTE
jgi:hypothetical protein